MPFKWREIFAKENTLAKAATDRAVNEHANQHDLVAASVRELQDEHDKLEHACSVVIAQFTTAQDHLERDLALQRQLDSQGKAASKVGHADAASAIAHQLVAVNRRLDVEQKTFDTAKTAADEAKAAFAENGELLAAKMQEAKELDVEIDQAAMEHNINEARKSVASMTSHVTPSFDEVRDRVQARHAQEQADAALIKTDAGNDEVHELHLLNSAAADDVMASWGTPETALAPASGSPTDRLNS